MEFDASIVISPLESISKVVESISIGASEFVPIPIEVGESILRAPDEETDKVPCPSNVVLPPTSKSKLEPTLTTACVPIDADKNVPADAEIYVSECKSIGPPIT